MDSNDAIPISALQHFIYCPRQCGLIHVAQVWSENLHTQKGRREHDRVDVPEYEMRAGVRIERALPVWSDAMGLIGKCDVVEFHADGSVYPVEYKHGPRKKGLHDDVQLCAQAICLEEMLGVVIHEGAIYHVKSRRRREVMLDEDLRAKVHETVAAVREMIEAACIPEPERGRHCEQCSLQNICMPQATEQSVLLFEPLSEDTCTRC
ncbi:MAG: CRISPR-associated protein Cas4 [Zetaproteobacteria bacterium CG06_land_8_20_14_3_00_59_53]|nr:MAG: CRISPR-associated protein Cas4 [Zetaproteobacteria bacterium CG2_30_59_37]PIO90311.1 MAG: CRISPR-associated protein Cas4 [Zetaproteobacteria bacterium CG23_combo_of_CG06-09_8_20_14_all_59_86]PIU70528.1 MAG: CRISPR-associated protein Cas4 [Zetaproteobacteria bacterium CG06_land_8_20_14_3_00_59_53]PIU97607.1 MAG: CRISPR-associated protein Cas4 [Zetaproteobacteria bacterium CG03_land_8_20_14_0_80_59_51]PIY47412.1 MAG: CRISPR-associated protein Cas4 [Zetaproteobacteria bacterium CG_4_10_14_